MLVLVLMGATELPTFGNVEWSDLVYTQGCFFFSGPANIGRDDPLGYQADVKHGAASLMRFNSVDFVQLSPGSFRRKSTHDFGGPWDVVQLIEGDWTGKSFAGTYSYTEQRKEGETGKVCTISADVRIRM